MVDTSPSTTPRTLAFIGCRLLALYVLYQGLQTTVFSGVTLWNREPGTVSDVIVHVMTLQIIFYGSMFVLFWFGAKSLSTRVAPIHETAQSPHITPLAHLLVAVSGLFFVLSGLAQMPSVVAGWLDGTPRSLEHTLTALSKIIVGTVVIAGRERIADFIQKARTV